MKTLYIGSAEPYAGKGWITLALGLKLKEKGLKLAYYRPIGTIPADRSWSTDKNERFRN